MKIAFLVLFISMVSFPALAQEDLKLMTIQDNIRREIEPILKAFDEKAYLTIKATPELVSQKLPTTPFSITQMNLNKDGKISLASIRVEIYSSSETLPDEVKSLIESLLKTYTDKIDIQTRRMPTSFLEMNFNPWKQVGQWIYRPDSWVQLALVLTIVLFGSWFSISKKSTAKQVQGTIQQGFSQLTSAFEVSAGGSSNREEMEKASASSDLPQLTHDEDSDQMIAHLPSQSLLALLTDCYWCEEDGYASFLWRKTPVQSREALLQQVPFLKEYCQFLMSIVPQNLQKHQEPYYLSPFPIEKISNADLTQLIKKQVSFLSRLPSLRAENLSLSPKEKIDALSKTDAKDLDWEKTFGKADKTSSPRVLKKQIPIKIRNLEDESQILELEDLALDYKLQLPSLGWLLALSDDEIRDLLHPYPASSLAQIWIGPENVLQKIRSCIPEKKMNLIESYLEKGSPNRDRPLMREISAKALRTLEAHHKNLQPQENAVEDIRRAS